MTESTPSSTPPCATTSSTSAPTTAPRATSSTRSIPRSPKRAAWKEILARGPGRPRRGVGHRQRAHRHLPRRRLVAHQALLARREAERGRRAARPSDRRPAHRALGRRRGVLRFLVVRRAAHRLPARPAAPGKSEKWEGDRGPIDSARVRGRAHSRDLEGRHRGADVRGAQEGHRARRAHAHAAHRLRRVQHQHRADASPARATSCSSAAGSSRSPTCAAAASSARTGTRPGCWSNKQNVFDDAIAAASELVAERLHRLRRTSRVMGGSNGGLLVGALVTQRPELFRAAVCSVPLLDMVRYHRFRIAKLWIARVRLAGRRRSSSSGSTRTRPTTT